MEKALQMLALKLAEIEMNYAVLAAKYEELEKQLKEQTQGEETENYDSLADKTQAD